MDEQQPSLEDMLAGFADVVSAPPKKWSLAEMLEKMASEPPRIPAPVPPLICHIDDPEWCGMTIEEFVKAAHGYPIVFLRNDGSIFRLEDEE